MHCWRCFLICWLLVVQISALQYSIALFLPASDSFPTNVSSPSVPSAVRFAAESLAAIKLAHYLFSNRMYEPTGQKRLNQTYFSVRLAEPKYAGFSRAAMLQNALDVTSAPQKPIAAIGPAPLASSLGELIAPFAEYINSPLLAPWAGLDDLDSAESFPYFSRLSSPNSFEAAGIMEMCSNFNWATIGLIYSQDDYASDTASFASILQTMSASADLYIAVVTNFKVSSTNVTREIESALLTLQKSHIRIFLLSTTSDYALQVLRLAHSIGLVGKQYVWIGTRSWLSDSMLFQLSANVSLSSDALQGVVGFSVFVNESSEDFKSMQSFWNQKFGPDFSESYGIQSPKTSALSFDAYFVLASALNELYVLNSSCSISACSSETLNDSQKYCCSIQKGFAGSVLHTLLRSWTFTGAIGAYSGGNLSIQMLNFHESSIQSVGKYEDVTGLSFTSSPHWFDKTTSVPSDIPEFSSNTEYISLWALIPFWIYAFAAIVSIFYQSSN